MTIINLINLLDSIFTTSFKHTSRVLYSVSFETSNINTTRERLKELEHNFTNNITTKKHVGAQITSDDITLVSTCLNALILHYEIMNEIHAIPSRLKLHEMLKEIRENAKPDIKAVAKEVVTEILKPTKTEKQLSKKEQLAENADKKSTERKLAIIKKLGKQGN
jgi:hypothetical protein